MDLSDLAVWRNLALILLGIEGVLGLIAPLVALVFAYRGVRRLRFWLRPRLTYVRQKMSLVQLGSQRVASVSEGLVVGALGLGAGLARGIRAFFGR